MNSQQRVAAGARHSGEPAGGRWASKTVPTIKTGEFGFGDDTPPIGAAHDWTEQTVKIWGTRTTFTRTVDSNGKVTVTADCDPPDTLLLARKGDIDYWSDNKWAEHYEDRRIWSAEITRQMLQEGLVATGYEDDTEGIQAAMSAASSQQRSRNPHAHAVGVSTRRRAGNQQVGPKRVRR